MRALVVLALVVSLHGRGSADPEPWGNEGSAAPAATSAADEMPSAIERHKLAQETCPAVKAPWFFRVEKNGKVSYLLGTHHIGVSFEKFPKVVHDTLAHSKRVVFELAPDDHHARADAKDKEVSLPDALGPMLWQHYRELMGAHFADAHQRTTPLLASLLLVVQYDDLSAMLEREIEHDARGLKLPMQGLETEDFQSDLLVKLFDIRMLRAMLASIKDRTEIREETIKNLRRYCEGTAMEPFFDDRTRKALHDVGYSDKDLTSFENAILFDRNASWIPKLEELFASGDIFVAVGAAHLQGPKGVPDLLKAKGYTVTRITP